ncbi:MAG: MFS transporter [Anaerolineae bacterium]
MDTPAPSLASTKALAQRQGFGLRALYFLYYLATAAWLPFLPVYLREVGLPGVQVGVITGVGPAVQVLCQPIWGLIADLRGRRRALLFAMLAAAVLLPGYAGPRTFWLLAGWAVLCGFFANAITPLIDSLTLDHVEERRSGSYGSVRCWGAIGWGAGGLLIGRVLMGRDLRLSFVIAGILMLIGLAVNVLVVRETRLNRSFGKHWRGAGQLLRQPRLLVFLGLMVLLQMGSAAVWSFHSVYLSELGASRWLLGASVAVRGLSELPVFLVSAAIIRRLGVRPTLILATAVFGMRELAYSLIRVPEVSLIVEAAHGPSFSLLLVAATCYVHEIVPREWRATGQALLTAALFGAGGLLGNACSGWLYDRLGILGMFRVNGLWVLGLAIVALLILRRPADDPALGAPGNR